MAKIFTLIALIITLSSSSQPTSTDHKSNSELSQSEFAKLKNDYPEMIRSKSYLLMKENMVEFGRKVPSISKDDLTADEKWSVWIANNIKKTGFKTIEEANKLREEGVHRTKAHLETYKEFYKRFNLASLNQRKQILKDEREGKL